MFCLLADLHESAAPVVYDQILNSLGQVQWVETLTRYQRDASNARVFRVHTGQTRRRVRARVKGTKGNAGDPLAAIPKPLSHSTTDYSKWNNIADSSDEEDDLPPPESDDDGKQNWGQPTNLAFRPVCHMIMPEVENRCNNLKASCLVSAQRQLCPQSASTYSIVYGIVLIRIVCREFSSSHSCVCTVVIRWTVLLGISGLQESVVIILFILFTRFTNTCVKLSAYFGGNLPWQHLLPTYAHLMPVCAHFCPLSPTFAQSRHHICRSLWIP